MDLLQFRGLFESCERLHCAEVIEETELKIAIAAYGAGGDGAWETIQKRLDMYRDAIKAEPHVKELTGMDFRRAVGMGGF